jgi:DNA-binding transcriptional LysR family regulator
MEFHQLTSFVTVARTGNVTRAAAELNTTPPAVSIHIRQLEEELGLVLFTRTSRGMHLTSEGEGMELENRIFSNDDITKAAFIEQGLAVSVLELSEANGYVQREKAFLWQGEDRFETPLFFVYSRQRAEDRLIRTVTACLTDTWKLS